MRRTPMRRGAVEARRRGSIEPMARAIAVRGTPGALARRIAVQLTLKFDEPRLDDRLVWSADGDLLKRDADRLRHGLGLSERQIAQVLPKLSAREVEGFLVELSVTDRRIARTILNASLEAADPRLAGRRYLDEYRRVEAELQSLEPRLARTVANATFTARAPRNKAVELLRQFGDVMARFEGDANAARMLAKAAFRARDPLRAADEFLSEYQAVARRLVSTGIDIPAARTLAGLRRLRRHPRPGDGPASARTNTETS
jgi:hypothetical protein